MFLKENNLQNILNQDIDKQVASILLAQLNVFLPEKEKQLGYSLSPSSLLLSSSNNRRFFSLLK
jgi:hypothetical protein